MRCHRLLAIALAAVISLAGSNAWAQGGGGGGATGGTTGGSTQGGVTTSEIGSTPEFQTDVLGVGGTFVGASAEAATEAFATTTAVTDSTTTTQAQSGRGTTQTGATNGGQQGRAGGGGTQRQAARSTRTVINGGGSTSTSLYYPRPNYRVTFNYARPSATPVTTLVGRVQRAVARAGLSTPPPVVTIEGSTVVLQGEVPTERDLLLIQRLVGLEPGVAQIRNELQVVESLAVPQTAAPADTLQPVGELLPLQ